MELNKLDKAVIVFGVVMLTVAGAILGAAVMYDGGNSATAPETNETTPQPTVSENEVPDEVKDSLPTAKRLKQSLNENGQSNASVSISQQGEVIVHYNSEAGSGPELKSEMAEIATTYANSTDENSGGLTVAANGVKLMVSNDAAIAYSEGRLKDNAFKQTFHWSTVSQSETPQGDN